MMKLLVRLACGPVARFNWAKSAFFLYRVLNQLRQNAPLKQSDRFLDDYRADNPAPFLILGLLLVLLLVGGLGSWSIIAKLNSAVIVPGTVTVETKRRTVQHLDGGIVKNLLVRDGDFVKRGQLLLRLDDTVDKANVAIIDGQLDDLKVQRARLVAEYGGLEEFRLPNEIAARVENRRIKAVIAGQAQLFKAGLKARAAQAAILKQRIARFQEEISGLEIRHRSKERQEALLNTELAGLRKLHKKGYAPVTRILALEREAERLIGEMATDQTEMSRARNSIEEVELERIHAERDFRQSVAESLRKAETETAVLQERRIAAVARLERVEVKAPENGTVLGLSVHTIGGVIKSGEPILDIVPEGDSLVVEVQLPTTVIDKVSVGQFALVRLSALKRDKTPEVEGKVVWVSADRISQTQSNLPPYYLVRIEMDEQNLFNLGDASLTPGMPVEVFIRSGERTVINYLLKPFNDSLMRTFSEG